MPILASRLRCWSLNQWFWATRAQVYSVMANSDLNPFPTKRALDESLGQSPKKLRLDDGPSTDVDNVVKMGSGSESEGEILQGSSGAQAKKGNSKQKKRGWRAREEVERAPQLDEEGNVIPKAPRYPKRQCALLLGFCGSGYSGMQMCGMDYLNILWRMLMSC